ncbi:small ribosomal subunit protein uS7-like [Corticium candelabrum]|uniref:small ribosomal subunit protein uS7-like n=1 Tax=Corticium candelabrum TaxID=121492 RepID=UPI002E25D165|nr:small ribosomal subunit protein uS7-like [Corticium candelabrum]
MALTQRSFWTFSFAKRLFFARLPLSSSVYKKPQSIEFTQKADWAPSHSSPSLFYDELANKFINCMMWDGKKSLSTHIFRNALEIIKRQQMGSKSGHVTEPMDVFHQALENCKPAVGIVRIRRSGRTYQIPTPLPERRRTFLAIKWLITAARKRGGHGMDKRLATELMDAYNREGSVIKKKIEMHKLANANRVYAHYQWG